MKVRVQTTFEDSIGILEDQNEKIIRITVNNILTVIDMIRTTLALTDKEKVEVLRFL